MLSRTQQGRNRSWFHSWFHGNGHRQSPCKTRSPRSANDAVASAGMRATLLVVAVMAVITVVVAIIGPGLEHETQDRWSRGSIETIGAGLTYGVTLGFIRDEIADRNTMSEVITARPGIFRCFMAATIVGSLVVVLLSMVVGEFLWSWVSRRVGDARWRRRRERAALEVMEEILFDPIPAGVSDSWDDAHQLTGPLGHGSDTGDHTARQLTRATAATLP
jgi:hypothetical protein